MKALATNLQFEDAQILKEKIAILENYCEVYDCKSKN